MPETTKILYILILCALPAALGVTSCTELSEEESKQVEAALRDTLLSTTESWDMRINLLDQGKKVLRLRGQHATTVSRSDTQITRIAGPVRIQIYDSAGTVSTRIQSKRARYFSRQSQIKLYGDVEVQTKDQKTLLTEYLRWNQQDDQVNSNRFVIFTTEKDSITGHGFTGALDLSNYRIHDVSGHFTREQQQDTVSQ